MLKSEHLNILRQIIDSGSFKAAAEALYVSQPSISVAIKKLEEDLGFSLFDRSEYRPQLTPQGKLFYERAKYALLGVENLKDYAESLKFSDNSELSIAVDSILPANFVMKHIFSPFYKETLSTIDLHMEVLSGAYEKLIEKKVDLIFSPWFAHFDESKVEKRKVTSITMLPMVHKDLYSLEAKDLVRIPHIIVKDSAKKMNHSVGLIEGSHKIFVNDPKTKEHLILKGYGWGRVPSYILTKKRMSYLKQLPEEIAPTGHIDIFMARRKGTELCPILSDLWKKF